MEQAPHSYQVVIEQASAKANGDHVVLSLKVHDNYRKRLVSIEAPMTLKAADGLLIALLNPAVDRAAPKG